MDNVFKAMGVRLMQRVESRMDALLPRQATVTRYATTGVWVRFIDEDATQPESWFPSTIAGLPVGSRGWVIRLGGNKGLFIANNLRTLRVDSDSENLNFTVSSAGDYPAPATATLNGYPAGATVTANVTVSGAISITTSSSCRFGFQIITGGNVVGTIVGPAITISGNGRLPISHKLTSSIVVGADGSVSAVPIIRWSSGTVSHYESSVTLEII